MRELPARGTHDAAGLAITTALRGACLCHPLCPKRKPRLWDVKGVPRLTQLVGSPEPTRALLADTVPPSAEEKRIYRLPVFTAPFCRALLEELEHFEQSDMPKGRPNTMNNYGVGEVPRGGRGGRPAAPWASCVALSCLGLLARKMRSWKGWSGVKHARHSPRAPAEAPPASLPTPGSPCRCCSTSWAWTSRW